MRAQSTASDTAWHMPFARIGAAVGALVLALVVLTTPAAGANALDLLGSYDPGTFGLNASATGLNGVAYLGSWGSTEACASLGARVVDIHNPSLPVPIGTVAAYPRMTTEHLVARNVSDSAYSGAVLWAGIQRCDPAGGDEGGLAAWDVTDPNNPRELSYFGVGRRPRGVHEFAIGQQNNRWLAFLAVPNSEYFGGPGDLRILDVTDPANPVPLADWGAQKDLGLQVGYNGDCAPACRGHIAQAFLHSVALSPDSRTAYLSYWDLGEIILDVSDPTAPRFLGRFAEPQSNQGDTHSVWITPDGRTALLADEEFEPPWGYLRILDVRDPSHPMQIGRFDTANSLAQRPGGPETWYSIHNPLVDDRNPTHAYLAWYADGVRLVDFSDPSNVQELASWVPAHDAQVWSVALMDDVVIVGDVNTGLYVLRR